MEAKISERHSICSAGKRPTLRNSSERKSAHIAERTGASPPYPGSSHGQEAFLLLIAEGRGGSVTAFHPLFACRLRAASPIFSAS
jgi:hypothetical protein